MLSRHRSSLFEAEHIVVIYALELVQARGLDSVWLEVDSTYNVSYIVAGEVVSCAMAG